MNTPIAVGQWQTAAACTDMYDTFVPSETAPHLYDEARAKKICGFCPVRYTCLAEALDEEGRDTQWARIGVRGGLNPAERAHRAGAPAQKATPIDPQDYADVDTLLIEGRLTDNEISDRTGIPRSSVNRRRHDLGLLPARDRRTPLSVFAEQTREVGDGHREWINTTGGIRPQITLGRRLYTPGQLAFLASYGREPDGHVKTHCGHPGCLAGAHIADRTLRNARAAA